MMSLDAPRFPRFVTWSALLLLAAAMLWVAVWLIQQIWIGLVVIAAVVIIGWISFRILRWRRDRWLK